MAIDTTNPFGLFDVVAKQQAPWLPTGTPPLRSLGRFDNEIPVTSINPMLLMLDPAGDPDFNLHVLCTTDAPDDSDDAGLFGGDDVPDFPASGDEMSPLLDPLPTPPLHETPPGAPIPPLDLPHPAAYPATCGEVESAGMPRTALAMVPAELPGWRARKALREVKRTAWKLERATCGGGEDSTAGFGKEAGGYGHW